MIFCLTLGNLPHVQAADIVVPPMPKPGVMVNLSASFTPAHLKGMTVHPDNALQFDFLMDRGENNFSDEQKKEEYTKLIKYFLASLTIADKDQWVNLSPFENNRIIENNFGKTEMGRDLLAQDYLLKQVTSSLMYPESGLGKKFWDDVYAKAFKELGHTNIPVNTINKVWIMPDEAVVYESKNTAVILKSHLKVMLEQDYLAMQKKQAPVKENTATSQVIRDVILPALEKEVNEGKNFAQLRQIVSAMILATWYKQSLKESLLGRVYADKSKVKGVDQDPKTNDAIYQQYLAAFKKGVYSYIKEDEDKYTNQIIPRKYFAGGFVRDKAMAVYRADSPAFIGNEIAEWLRNRNKSKGDEVVRTNFETSAPSLIGDISQPMELWQRVEMSRVDVMTEANNIGNLYASLSKGNKIRINGVVHINARKNEGRRAMSYFGSDEEIAQMMYRGTSSNPKRIFERQLRTGVLFRVYLQKNKSGFLEMITKSGENFDLEPDVILLRKKAEEDISRINEELKKIAESQILIQQRVEESNRMRALENNEKKRRDIILDMWKAIKHSIGNMGKKVAPEGQESRLSKQLFTDVPELTEAEKNWLWFGSKLPSGADLAMIGKNVKITSKTMPLFSIPAGVTNKENRVKMVYEYFGLKSGMLGGDVRVWFAPEILTIFARENKTASMNIKNKVWVDAKLVSKAGILELQVIGELVGVDLKEKIDRVNLELRDRPKSLSTRGESFAQLIMGSLRFNFNKAANDSKPVPLTSEKGVVSRGVVLNDDVKKILDIFNLKPRNSSKLTVYIDVNTIGSALVVNQEPSNDPNWVSVELYQDRGVVQARLSKDAGYTDQELFLYRSGYLLQLNANLSNTDAAMSVTGAVSTIKDGLRTVTGPLSTIKISQPWKSSDVMGSPMGMSQIEIAQELYRDYSKVLKKEGKSIDVIIMKNDVPRVLPLDSATARLNLRNQADDWVKGKLIFQDGELELKPNTLLSNEFMLRIDGINTELSNIAHNKTSMTKNFDQKMIAANDAGPFEMAVGIIDPKGAVVDLDKLEGKDVLGDAKAMRDYFNEHKYKDQNGRWVADGLFNLNDRKIKVVQKSGFKDKDNVALRVFDNGKGLEVEGFASIKRLNIQGINDVFLKNALNASRNEIKLTKAEIDLQSKVVKDVAKIEEFYFYAKAPAGKDHTVIYDMANKTATLDIVNATRMVELNQSPDIAIMKLSFNGKGLMLSGVGELKDARAIEYIHAINDLLIKEALKPGVVKMREEVKFYNENNNYEYRREEQKSLMRRMWQGFKNAIGFGVEKESVADIEADKAFNDMLDQLSKEIKWSDDVKSDVVKEIPLTAFYEQNDEKLINPMLVVLEKSKLLRPFTNLKGEVVLTFKENSITYDELSEVLNVDTKKSLLSRIKAFESLVNVLKANGVITKDSAMAKGGIDLNAQNFSLDIKRDGKGVALPIAEQDMEKLNRIEGFVPRILEIKPVFNLPILSELEEKLKTAPKLASST